MPALSPTMTQGNIGVWHVALGSPLSPGLPMVEIETDKAQMDLECTEDGFLAQILLQEGSKDVLVNKPIAVMVEEEADVAAFKDFTLADVQEGGEKVQAEESGDAKEIVEQVEKQKEVLQETVSERVFGSPAAKELADKMNIQLASVTGTGPDGLVIKRNVQDHNCISFFIYFTKAAAPVAAPVVQATAPPAQTQAPVQPTLKKTPPTPLHPSTVTSSYTDTPVSNIRKIIASRLLQSTQTIPHYYLTMEINVQKVVKLRQALNGDADGMFKLSVNDFVIKASALALQKVPAVNSSWHETFIRQHANADICVAVATPTGLITPLLTSSNTLGLSQISQTLKSLAHRARLNQLSPAEYTGGSFTISNLGMYGVKNFTAIINPPHAAILAVGGISEKVVMRDGNVKVEEVMEVTLSLDHRVVDGAVGAEWLKAFKGFMENPLTMML